MSRFDFIASDRPIPEVENPYIQIFSVNEALEKGIEVPKVLLEKADLDRNKKVILICDSEEQRKHIFPKYNGALQKNEESS